MRSKRDETPFADEWRIVKSVRNPWGRVPVTDSGRPLDGRAKEYMSQLLAKQRALSPVTRRHHYVPQAYLRQWSTDRKRVWTWDTVSGRVGLLGIADLCVKEDFYRVVGPDGAPHNKVESLFGVVDEELRRVQLLFAGLQDPQHLTFDDLLGLGVSMAMQRMRTLQQRRIHLQYNRWLVAQAPEEFTSFDDPSDPLKLAGIHTRLIFKNMWAAADVLTTRQIEVWHDDEGRFMTCDAPVLAPFDRSRRFDLYSAPYVLWSVSPHRVVALSSEHIGEKAAVREANGKMVGIVRRAVEQGRERMIFVGEEQCGRLKEGRTVSRRPQARRAALARRLWAKLCRRRVAVSSTAKRSQRGPTYLSAIKACTSLLPACSR